MHGDNQNEIKHCLSSLYISSTLRNHKLHRKSKKKDKLGCKTEKATSKEYLINTLAAQRISTNRPTWLSHLKYSP
jgi:hypothetical protein